MVESETDCSAVPVAAERAEVLAMGAGLPLALAASRVAELLSVVGFWASATLQVA
jgi:hypothetical protein